MTWRDETRAEPLARAVLALKRAAEAAYMRGDEDAADAAHDDLTAAEWRLRQAMRRAGA